MIYYKYRSVRYNINITFIALEVRLDYYYLSLKCHCPKYIEIVEKLDYNI